MIEEQSKKVEQRIDALLLVGGFAGSEYLIKRVEVCLHQWSAMDWLVLTHPRGTGAIFGENQSHRSPFWRRHGYSARCRAVRTFSQINCIHRDRSTVLHYESGCSRFRLFFILFWLCVRWSCLPNQRTGPNALHTSKRTMRMFLFVTTGNDGSWPSGAKYWLPDLAYNTWSWRVLSYEKGNWWYDSEWSLVDLVLFKPNIEDEILASLRITLAQSKWSDL